MEILIIADEIEKKIKLLEKMRIEIKERAENKANTIAEYDKQLAITIIKLKNGNELEIEGNKISNIPATLIEKIAKGICWQAKLNMEKADAMYKSLISNIDSVQAELCGYQSINRYLEKG
jgi:hypothetical protein